MPNKSHKFCTDVVALIVITLLGSRIALAQEDVGDRPGESTGGARASVQPNPVQTGVATAEASATNENRKSIKAGKKADRKLARAKKNAELKKLEDAGYNPARHGDANYPQDVQNAEKKAGVAPGTSQ